MARHPRNPVEFDEEDAGTSLLARSLMWGGLAVVALGGATLSGQSETGAQRLATLMQGTPVTARQATPPAPAVATRPADSDEARRLADSVRLLAADRDRLLARVDALERNLDVTGSINQDTPAPAAPPTAAPMSAPLPPGWSMVPSTIPPAAGIPSATLPPPGTFGTSLAPAPAPAERAGALTANEQAAELTVTKTEFGVDVGGDNTLDGLRALWSSIKGSHAALFDGLRPLVAVKEGAKPGALELRLVAGPLANAVAAARLCATLSAAGVACRPTIFDGQRLALR